MNKKQFLENIKDPWYRLNNLYYILDKDGEKVLFRPNEAQAHFFRNMWHRNIILKARQLGFSTAIDIYMFDKALFYPNTACGIIAHTMNAATNLFDNKIRFAYDNLPDVIKEYIPAEQSNATTLKLANGSSIKVGTSHRSGTLQYLHVSEFGAVAARAPKKATEIVTGAFPTVPKNGYVFVESTAEGQEGAFYDMVERSRSLARLGKPLAETDYKFFFYPWFGEKTYVVDPERVTIGSELTKYFTKLEEKGIVLLPEQKAWYANEKETLKENMQREYPTIPEEAFEATEEGVYYGEQMAWLEANGHIRDVPWNPKYPVHTYWDIGMSDDTTIWFVQHVDGVNYVIECWSNSGGGLGAAAKYVLDRPYKYARHVGPHDSRQREWTGDGLKRWEMAEERGLKPWIMTNSMSRQEGIDAVRTILPRCYFDKNKCADGLKALKHYKRDWDDKNGRFMNAPRHDWASHYSDAFRYFAVAPQPEDEDANSDWNKENVVKQKYGGY